MNAQATNRPPPRSRPGPTLLVALAALAAAPGCFSARSSSGGGETTKPPPPTRTIRTSDIALPGGYVIEVVATGLNFPTGVTFDDAGQVYVTESGYSYGEVFTTPRLLRIEPGGGTTVVATGKNPPWTGVAWADGAFIVSEGGVTEGGRILRIAPDGQKQTLVAGLPSFGDHHTNGPVVGPDGFIYFGQGTATNSGIVGEDNHKFGWLKRHPEFHDVPCKDVTLTGAALTSPNPLTPRDEDDKVTTGAFVPFGTQTQKGQVIPGKVPCSGAVMRVPVRGGTLNLVAWGFRNPFGLAFSPDGKLFVTDNGYDDRGSRPVWGNADHLWAVTPGTWYGWPDFADGRPVSQDRYAPPGGPTPPTLLEAPPNPPPQPVAFFAVHSSSNGIDIARDPSFGFAGEAFVAQFGDQAPDVGKVLHPVGFKVVRVDLKTGVIRDFAVNRGKDNGPASRLKSGGLERPISVRFDRTGRSLYVVDFGVMLMDERGAKPQQGTGALFRITRAATAG
ncbi:sorbosone dehydrogenase family protein [Sorangium cellulosum]|uniref:PQQ-dependent sugar dehydrogenase n=1 Tax=Sorangium cellulosum TaxID=56 RepID=UPI003D9A966A